MTEKHVHLRHALGQGAIQDVRDESSALMNTAHVITVNAPIKGELNLAGIESVNQVKKEKHTKTQARKQKHRKDSPPVPSGQQTAAQKLFWIEDQVRERLVSAEENADRAKRNP